MKRLHFILPTVVCVLLLTHCGDSSTPTTTPTAPPVSTAVTLTITSGETGQPIAGAVISVGGRDVVSSGNGTASVDPLPVGTDVTITAAGFLVRESRFRSPSETTLSLWPRTSPTGLDEATTRLLLYTSARDDAVPGALDLFRPSNSQAIILVPDQQIRADVRALRIVEESAQVLADALGGRVPVRVGTASDGGTQVEITIDAESTSSDFVGRWQIFVIGRTTSSALITFRSLSRLIDNAVLMTHNLGHIAGLRHTDNSNDRMSARWWERTRNNFSPREVLVLRLAYQRRPGNRFPDNDRGADMSLQRTSAQFGSH